MKNIRIRKKIKQEVRNKYGVFYSSLGGVDADKITADVLSVKKVDEQIGLIELFLKGSVKRKKILEIGSGFGLFVVSGIKKYDADVFGVEPSAEGFDGSFEVSQKILKDNGIPDEHILCGVAEKLPYDDNVFDIVYSTNVFEHVQDPARSFKEAIRVCKPGGLIQIVIPNYGSFYEGHFASWYVPYIPKYIFKMYVRYVLKRNYRYVDGLQTGLNYFSIKKILKPYLKNKKIKILSFGEEVFKKRMNTGNFAPYAGLTKVERVLTFFRKLKLVYIISVILLAIKAHSPLIITLRKN